MAVIEPISKVLYLPFALLLLLSTLLNPVVLMQLLVDGAIISLRKDPLIVIGQCLAIYLFLVDIIRDGHQSVLLLCKFLL